MSIESLYASDKADTPQTQTAPHASQPMQTLRTAILEHATTAGSHFDWLFENPEDLPGPLFAARVSCPTRLWRHACPFILTPLSPHRRIYLTYQGPLTRRRGQVRRIDQGHIRPLLWQPARRLLEIRTPLCHVRLNLQPLTCRPPHRWRATLLPPCRA